MKYYAGDTIQAKNRTVHAQYEIDQQAAIGSVDRAKSQDMVSPANRIRCGELWSSRDLSLPAGRQAGRCPTSWTRLPSKDAVRCLSAPSIDAVRPSSLLILRATI